MFQVEAKKTRSRTIFGMLELVYHATVREVFALLGMRGAAIRGDFLLYIMSGIFLFLTHTKAMGAVVGSEGPASPMMQHAPMNTAISITAAALASLYLQTLSLVFVLFIYHVAFVPVGEYDRIRQDVCGQFAAIIDAGAV